MASLVEGNASVQNIKLQEGAENKPNHIWKIVDTLFEGDVWENISDVNRAAPIIQARKRTSLSVFLGILFLCHCDNNFSENFKNIIVFYNY